LLFYGCINDEVLENVTEKHKHRYTTSYTTSDKAKILKPKIASFNQKHTNRDFEYDNLTLQLDKILVLSDSTENFKSYSILIEKNIPINVVYHVDNLHVMEKDEVLLEDFIIRWIPTNPEEKIDLKTFTGIVQKYDIDYNLVFENTYVNGVPFNQTASYAYPCTFTVVCACTREDNNYCGCNGAYSQCVFVGIVTCFSGGGGGDSGSGDGSGSGSDGGGLGGEGGGGGSGGGSNNDGTEDENEDTLHQFVPIVPELVDEEKTPCDKVKNIFTNLTNLKSELEFLQSKTSDTKEWGRYKVTTSNLIQTPPTTAALEVSFPVPSGKYVMLAHTHNSPASSTYSVFSWEDLEAFAALMKNDKIDSEQFVAFLITADGTSFALTIDNPDKFKKFFALSYEPNFDLSIAEKRVSEAKKYYGLLDPDPNPIIKENNLDTVADEKAFLDILQNNDLGLSLFEVNPTFTAFDKVSHDKTTGIINKQPCN